MEAIGDVLVRIPSWVWIVMAAAAVAAAAVLMVIGIAWLVSYAD
jgi:hypothetical protein